MSSPNLYNPYRWEYGTVNGLVLFSSRNGLCYRSKEAGNKSTDSNSIMKRKRKKVEQTKHKKTDIMYPFRYHRPKMSVPNMT